MVAGGQLQRGQYQYLTDSRMCLLNLCSNSGNDWSHCVVGIWWHTDNKQTDDVDRPAQYLGVLYGYVMWTILSDNTSALAGSDNKDVQFSWYLLSKLHIQSCEILEPGRLGFSHQRSNWIRPSVLKMDFFFYNTPLNNIHRDVYIVSVLQLLDTEFEDRDSWLRSWGLKTFIVSPSVLTVEAYSVIPVHLFESVRVHP